jgi:hypothetical protein
MLESPYRFLIAEKAYRLEKRILELPTGPLPHWLPEYSESNLQSLAAARPLRDEVWPYWLEDWPASWGLAAIGVERANSSAHYPMADIGCGSGWLACALGAHLQGAWHAFDFNTDACRLGAFNWKILHPNLARFNPHFICADAGRLPTQIKYRTLFGGEMLYHPETRDLALGYLNTHLHSEGVAYFADSGRSPADGFSDFLGKSDYQVKTLPIQTLSGKNAWRVFEVSRKGAIPSS